MAASFARGVRATGGWGAILALGLAWGITMHDVGWAQLANFAQVKAFSEGQAQIDPWHWETKDKAYVDGSFYSVKAPGLPLATYPAYALADAVGAEEAAAGAARNARGSRHPKWSPVASPPYAEHAFSAELARETELGIEREAPLIWLLALVGAVLPAMALLVSVRWAADRLVPGYGVAAAVTLGLATVIMTFASQYFSHVAAAALAFGAFAVLMRERETGSGFRLVALAGLLCGLAVTFEYPLGLVGIVLFAYALGTAGNRVRRAVAFGAAAVAGTLPLFAFNWWAFGSPFDFAYGDAVAVQGHTGHEVLGLNDDGFFGITLPRLDGFAELLLSGRGVLTLTPVLLLGVVGAIALRRGERRAEANVILAVAAAYLLYNSGYWLPMGGGTPGPRFLIPALPFLALGIAEAYRRMPAITLGLAIPSAVLMVVGSITFPLIGENGIRLWWVQLVAGDLEHTILTAIGVSEPWVAILPVLALLLLAATLAVRASPPATIGSIGPALAALGVWAVVSIAGPSVAGDSFAPLGGGSDAIWLIGGALALSVVTLAALRLAAPRPQGASRRLEPEPTS